MRSIENENLSHLKSVCHLLPSLGGAADKKTVMAASNARDSTRHHAQKVVMTAGQANGTQRSPWPNLVDRAVVNPFGRVVNIAPELLISLTRRASSVAHYVQTGARIASAVALANDAAWAPTWVNPPPTHPV